MKSLLKKYLAVTCVALAPLAAKADFLEWTLNYAGADAAGGTSYATNSESNLTNEYKYTAESVVAFKDNGDGVLGAGDTFDDYIVVVIDQLNYNGTNNFDPDYALGRLQLTAVIKASGIQTSATTYKVTGAELSMYYDNLDANFANLSTFGDGLLVQTGLGTGGGSNDPNLPDGNIDIFFKLTDILSTYSCGQDQESCGQFEMFDPFYDLGLLTFVTDSNNNLCTSGSSPGVPAGTANCFSTAGNFASYFGFDYADYDFWFHTRSDGSAVKVTVPEPFTLGLFGLGLIGLGLSRTRKSPC